MANVLDDFVYKNYSYDKELVQQNATSGNHSFTINVALDGYKPIMAGLSSCTHRDNRNGLGETLSSTCSLNGNTVTVTVGMWDSDTNNQFYYGSGIVTVVYVPD